LGFSGGDFVLGQRDGQFCFLQGGLGRFQLRDLALVLRVRCKISSFVGLIGGHFVDFVEAKPGQLDHRGKLTDLRLRRAKFRAASEVDVDDRGARRALSHFASPGWPDSRCEAHHPFADG
jgi:hypothetical protein